MFKLTLLPSMSHELSLVSHPSIAVGVLYRLAPTSSSACRSQDHTFVQQSRNFHRPTHLTGCMQCVPWPPTGFSYTIRQHRPSWAKSPGATLPTVPRWSTPL